MDNTLYWKLSSTKRRQAFRERIKLTRNSASRKQANNMCTKWRIQKWIWNFVKRGSIHKSSKLLSLSPVMDAEGIIRSNSRLEFAECLPENTRFPVILPRKHQVTKLIVKRAHENTNYSGTNQTLAELTRDYWIFSAREEIREWETTCAEC